MHVSNKKIYFGFAIICLIIACNSTSEKTSAAKNTQSTDTTFMNGTEINLPEAAGADVFRANCVTCHSAKYIQMQPDFSRTAWEKITDKMIKNFGAPIPDSTVKTIVDYLVTIKGKK
jgi:cytochrome c5